MSPVPRRHNPGEHGDEAGGEDNLNQLLSRVESVGHHVLAVVHLGQGHVELSVSLKICHQ